MSKAKVNAILKTYGLANIKFMKNSMDSVTMKNWDGKMVKGVMLSTHSPMDVTSAASERIQNKIRKIKHDLMYGEFPMRTVGDRFVVAETSKSITYLALDVERYATYTRCRNLDDGYKTSYLVPYFYKESK